MEQMTNTSIYEYLNDINNKKYMQWLVTIKKINNCKIDIDKLYFNRSLNYKYYFEETKSIFHKSTKNAFSINDFEVFWEEIYSKIPNQIFTKDYFLSEKFEESKVITNLKIYFNFFINLYFNSYNCYNPREYQNPNKCEVVKRANEIYDQFKETYNEILKLIALLGYCFDNTKFGNGKFKIIKNAYKNLLDNNNNIKKELKSLLLEIAINSSLQELEKNLNHLYSYVEDERTRIKEILGNKIEQNIFMLMNKVIKHKEKEKDFLDKINISEQEKKEIILYLKNIILFYFTCCDQVVYPETAIQKIGNKK